MKGREPRFVGAGVPVRAVAMSWRGLVAALGALLFAAPALAQMPGPLDDMKVSDMSSESATAALRSTAPIAGPVDADTYVLGPGDVLRFGFGGGLARQLTSEVNPEGNVLVADFGTVHLGGLTLTAAREEVRRRIGGGLRRDVRLELELVRVRLLRVFLSGDVKSAGAVELPATARASEALGDGNRIAEGGSRRNIELRHRDGTVERADLDRFLRVADRRFNPMLRDDDIVFVPPAREWITLSGAVAHEGRLERAPGDSLRLLVEMAGGLLRSARPESAQFIRWRSATERESLWISARAAAVGDYNPELRDGDRLLVYHLPEFHRFEGATIEGEVTRPGVYPLQHGATRLSDVIRAAGGFQPRADLSAIRIYRPRLADAAQDPELERLTRLSRNEMTNSEYEVLRTRLIRRKPDFRVDWHRLSSTPATDVVLVDGDIVRVEPTLASVRVEGQVRHPGLVRYAPGTDLKSYVENAGGFAARAAGGQTLVTRAVTGQTLRARDVSEIEPGDLIWVPERPDRSIWQNLGTLIAVAAQVSAIVIAVRR